MVLVWFWYGFGMVLICFGIFWYGFGIVLVWCSGVSVCICGSVCLCVFVSLCLCVYLDQPQWPTVAVGDEHGQQLHRESCKDRQTVAEKERHRHNHRDTRGDTSHARGARNTPTAPKYLKYIICIRDFDNFLAGN